MNSDTGASQAFHAEEQPVGTPTNEESLQKEFESELSAEAELTHNRYLWADLWPGYAIETTTTSREGQPDLVILHRLRILLILIILLHRLRINPYTDKSRTHTTTPGLKILACWIIILKLPLILMHLFKWTEKYFYVIVYSKSSNILENDNSFCLNN